MNENDILVCPQIFEFERVLNAGVVSELIDKKQKRQSISKDDKLEYQKYPDEKRSPGESVVGDKNFVIDKSLGLVFY
jgi:hypothetical protein